jgi:signal transduction histidine kinase
LKKLDDVSKTLDRALTSVREISYDLRPASLDLGLSRAIHQLVEEYSSRNGMKVDFVCAGVDELELDSDTKINLYRLIQESLNNVKKHARATRVTVRLVASFPKIILRVEDNGEGFDLQKERNGSPVNRHMGLWNMNERVGLLQGVMKIDTKPKQGTSILIEIPWKEQCLGQKANSLDR